MSTVIKASNRTRLKLRFCRLCMESSFIWTFIIGLGVSRDQRMPTRLTPCQITKGPAKVSATVCRARVPSAPAPFPRRHYCFRCSVTRLVESTVMSTGLPAPGRRRLAHHLGPARCCSAWHRSPRPQSCRKPLAVICHKDSHTQRIPGDRQLMFCNSIRTISMSRSGSICVPVDVAVGDPVMVAVTVDVGGVPVTVVVPVGVPVIPGVPVTVRVPVGVNVTEWVGVGCRESPSLFLFP